MSTVKATNFQHPSSAAANITLGSDGSVVLPAGFSGGLGTNVVQAVKTDTFSTTSATFTTVTGLSATITPSSASSKILVIAQIVYSVSGTDGNSAHFVIAGGNTSGYVGDAASNRVRSVFSTNNGTVNSFEYFVNRAMQSNPIVYLDSPATTSPTTYSVECRRGTGTVYVNQSGADADSNIYGRGASSITVIEVAA